MRIIHKNSLTVHSKKNKYIENNKICPMHLPFKGSNRQF